VHKTSRVSFQVRQRFYDRDGLLGWSRAEKFAVSRTESMFGDKHNPLIKRRRKKIALTSILFLSVAGNVGGGIRNVSHNVA